MKKAWIGVIAGVAVVVCAVVGIIKSGNSADGSSSGAVPVIPVSSLGNAASMASNRFSGIVETQKKKEVSLDPNQTIRKILVSEGNEVLEGDALFIYDTEKTELEIEQKELEKEKLDSSIQTLNEQIDQLNSELNKGELSSADRMTMNAQILENQTSIAQAEYDKKAADAEIGRMKASIKNSTVRAPMSGTIKEIADPATIYEESAAFIKIVADGEFRVKGTISEQNIGLICEGAEMIARSRVNPDRIWKGVVSSIETGGEGQEQDMLMNEGSGERATSYSFYVALESMDGLMLGQHVTLELSYGDEEIAGNGSLLPYGYVCYDEDGSAHVMAVPAPGEKLEKRPVEVGEIREDSGMVEILSGLTETDYVAWPENEDCVEGAATKADPIAEAAE